MTRKHDLFFLSLRQCSCVDMSQVNQALIKSALLTGFSHVAALGVLKFYIFREVQSFSWG